MAKTVDNLRAKVICYHRIRVTVVEEAENVKVYIETADGRDNRTLTISMEDLGERWRTAYLLAGGATPPAVLSKKERKKRRKRSF